MHGKHDAEGVRVYVHVKVKFMWTEGGSIIMLIPTLVLGLGKPDKMVYTYLSVSTVYA